MRWTGEKNKFDIKLQDGPP